MLGRQILAGSRVFLLFAVIGSLLSSVVLIIYGTAAVALIAWETFWPLKDFDPDVHHVERVAVDFIQLIDVFLLGAVLYIVGLGIHQLFLDPDIPLPPALRIASLDALKEKLVGVIIVLLGVTFLSEVVIWTGEEDILALGAAIALVIAALGIVFALTARQHAAHPPRTTTRCNSPGHAGPYRSPVAFRGTIPALHHPRWGPLGQHR